MLSPRKSYVILLVIHERYSNVRIYETRHLYSADHSANILDCLRPDSQVIPNRTSAAGLRPTWRPGKLTGQTQTPLKELSPRVGAGDLKRELYRHTQKP